MKIYKITPSQAKPSQKTKGAKLKKSLFLLAAILLSNMSFAQNISYQQLYDISSFSSGINLSLPVGTIEGKDETATNGFATYSIPIELPVGTNNIVPPISFNYSSSNGNGALGWGWTIAGLSNISRSNPTIFHDNRVRPTSLTNSDPFNIDGMRLVPVSGVNPLGNINGMDNTIYKTEVESYNQIKSYGTMGNGPNYFKVLNKDGNMLEYGNTPDSRVMDETNTTAFIWRLNKMTDVNGNYVEFIYTGVDRDFRIDEIKYTGNSTTGMTPYNRIKFNYKIRSDVNITYEAGSSFKSNYLLENLEIFGEGNILFKQYNCKYGKDDLHSFLVEVEEVGSDLTKFNPTKFMYGQQTETVTKESANAPFGFQNDYFTGDYDGDGYTDILALKRNVANGTNIVYYDQLAIFKRTALTNNYVQTYSQSLPANLSFVGIKKQVSPDNSRMFLSADFTGDGADDILITDIQVSGTGSNNTNQHIFNGVKILSGSNGATSFSTSSLSTLPVNLNLSNFAFDRISETQKHFLIQGDFDGDGNTDYITMLSTIVGTPLTAFFTSPSKSIYNEYLYGLSFIDIGLQSVTSFANSDELRIIDFDGDGKDEILSIHNDKIRIYSITSGNLSITSYHANIIYASGFPNSYHTVLTGDFNGDSKTDLLTRTNDAAAVWNISYSNGIQFLTSPFNFQNAVDINSQNNNYLPHPTDDHLNVADFNGDGKSDILHEYNMLGNKVAFDVYYSAGSKGTSSATANFFYKQIIVANSSINLGKHLIGDFNGDGQADYIDRHFDDPFKFVSISPYNTKRLLKKAKNGIGHTIHYEYELLTKEGSFYNRGIISGLQVNSIQPPIYAIKVISESIPFGGTKIKSFEYEGLKLHKEGRGMLGFINARIFNSESNIKTEITTQINYQYYIAYTQKIRESNTNTLLSTVENIETFVPLSWNTKVVDIQNTQIKTTNNLSGAISIANNVFDTHGNITVSSISNPAETITTTTSYAAFANSNFGNFVLNRPMQIAIQRTRNGEPSISKTTTYLYDTKGRMTQEKEFVNLAKWRAKNFSYNVFGNRTQTVLSGGGVQSLTTSANYDTKGRYIISSSNQLGQNATYAYSNPMFGNPSQKVSVEGYTTLYYYDGFGQKVQENNIDPAGTSNITTLHSLAWDLLGPSVYKSITIYPGRPDETTWYDIAGRKTKQTTEGFNGLVYQEWEYGNNGMLQSESKPHLDNETPVLTTFEYDDLNRLEKINTILGQTLINYQYNGVNLTETKTLPTGFYTQTKKDATGVEVERKDNENTTIYKYDSWGHVREVKLGGSVLSTTLYDAYGMQTELTDANSGTSLFNYNAYGQLDEQTNANGHVTKYTYDNLNRVIERTGVEGLTKYIYVNSGVGLNQLSKIEGYNGVDEEFEYNSRGQLITKDKKIDGVNYVQYFTKDEFGKIVSESNNTTSLILNREFDGNGFLISITDGLNNTIYQINQKNGLNQVENYTLGNGLTSNNQFSNGFLQSKTTSTIQDYTYNYDWTSGNIISRSDNLKVVSETFEYDIMNRMTKSEVAGQLPFTIEYGFNGNITSRNDRYGNLYKYAYSPTKLNAVTAIANVNAPFSAPPEFSIAQQTISYTPFNRVNAIMEDNLDYTFTYDAEYHRVKSRLMELGTIEKNIRFYVDDMEIDITNGVQHTIHYVTGEDGIVAMIVIDNNGSQQNYYTYTDHLGSILTVTDATATVVAEQSFDAWGRYRNPSDWSYTAIPDRPNWLFRGFTSHEHLPAFDLINMNARIYDPINGRMLSPDNYVQDAGNSQNLNRFSYALNNPIMYADPDGNFIGTAITGLVDFFDKAFLKGGLDPTSNNARRSAWRSFDPTAKWSKTNKGWRIDKGWFQTDKKRTIAGRTWELISRFTWEMPQTAFGNYYGHISNIGGRVTSVTYVRGAVVIDRATPDRFWWGMTTGNFINTRNAEWGAGSNNIDYEPINSQNTLFQHEWGHTFQSKIFGPLYFTHIMPLSGLSARFDIDNHSRRWFERMADSLSEIYFVNHP